MKDKNTWRDAYKKDNELYDSETNINIKQYPLIPKECFKNKTKEEIRSIMELNMVLYGKW